MLRSMPIAAVCQVWQLYSRIRILQTEINFNVHFCLNVRYLLYTILVNFRKWPGSWPRSSDDDARGTRGSET